MNTKESRFIFSQNIAFKFIANHGEKLFYLLVIIGVLFTYKDLKGQFLIDVALLIFVLFMILFFTGKFVAKIIWRLDVDFHSGKLSLYLCRNPVPRVIDFIEIDQIKVSGPIIIFAGQRKYYYSTNQYEEILPILQRVKRIQWGRMCNVLGPNKMIRKSIDGNGH